MMTTHPERDVLLAHADGELTGHEAGDIARHVARCAVCEATLSDLEIETGLFAGALRTLDGAEPAAWTPASEFAGASGGTKLPLHPRRPVHDGTGARSRGMLRWAAGILLVTSATAAAAVVGVRVLSGTAEPAATTATGQAVNPGVAAVIVSPFEGRLDITVTGAGAETRLFITLEDRSTASVAVEGDTPPRFRTVEGRVDVDLNGASGPVRLMLPRTLRAGTITADGVTRATVEGERVVPEAATAGGVLLHDSGW